LSQNFCRAITVPAKTTSIQYKPASGKEQLRMRNTTPEHRLGSADKPHRARRTAKDHSPGPLVEDPQKEFTSSLTSRQDNQGAEKRANDRKRRIDGGADRRDQPGDIDPMGIVRVRAGVITEEKMPYFRLHDISLPDEA
jgi:hypothetical protein